MLEVASDNPILNHEVFGPVAPVVTFDTDEEAITLANSTDYGLISYVYSEDLKRALCMAEAIEFGTVTYTHPTLPTNSVVENNWLPENFKNNKIQR